MHEPKGCTEIETVKMPVPLWYPP